MAKKFRITKESGIYSLMSVLRFFMDCSDGIYNVTINKERKPHSDEQQGYLWGCVYPMVREGMIAAGWDDIVTDEDAHEFCKSRFASRDIINRFTGEVESLPASTSCMDTKQYSDYVDAVRDWAAEFLNISIPDPNRWWKLLNEPAKVLIH